MEAKDKGYLVFALNNKENNTDYIKLAYCLALSIKLTQTIKNISVVVHDKKDVPNKFKWVFDKIIEIKSSKWTKYDEPMKNESYAYRLTPYQETIKLESDMLFSKDISNWWDLLNKYNFMSTTEVLTFRNQTIYDKKIRHEFYLNGIPNLYSGFVYFKKNNEEVKNFFEINKKIAEYSDFYYRKFFSKKVPKHYSTDATYSIASNIMGWANFKKLFPTFVHMKPDIQRDKITFSKWSDVLSFNVNSQGEIFIGNYKQVYPVHYFEKDIITDELVSFYERCLNV